MPRADMRRLLIFASALLVGAAAPPPGALNCSGCHGESALPIDGMDAAALASAMTAYQSGEGAATSMGRLMKGLTPDEIRAIAAWISVQK